MTEYTGATTAATTERMIGIIAGAWFALWSVIIAASVVSGTGGYPVPVVLVTTSVALLTSLALLAGWPGSTTATVVVMAVQATVLLAVTSTYAVPVGTNGYTTMLAGDTASIAFGMLLRPALARLLIVTLTVGTALRWTQVVWASGQWSTLWPEVPIATSYVLADGMAALTVMTALRRSAAHADASNATLALVRATRQFETRLRAGLASAARQLHETAVNTLGVIARGQVTSDTSTLRERCGHDRDVLRRLRAGESEPPPPPWRRPDWWRARGEALGLDLTVVVGGEHDEGLLGDDRASTTAAALLYEALLNTARHAGVSSATLSVATSQSGDVTASLVDTGIGFAVAEQRRGAVWRYLCAEAELYQVAVGVSSVPGRGTSTDISWHPLTAPPPATPAEDAETPVDAAAAFDRVIPLVGARFTGWLMLTVVVCTVAGILTGGPLTSLLALGLLAASTVWALRTAAGGTELPWPPRAALVVAAPLVIWLQNVGVTTCDATSMTAWGSLGALVALTLLAWLGRSRVELGVGIAASLAVGLFWTLQLGVDACTSSTMLDLVADMSVVIAVATMRSVLVRYGRRAAAADERTKESRELAQRRDAVDIVLRDALDTQLEETADFLDALAGGGLDHREPEVRARAGALEASLRQLIALGTRLEGLSPSVLRVLARARERGVDVDLRVGSEPQAPPTGMVAEIESAMTGLIDVTPAGERVTIGVFTVTDGTSLTASFPAAAPTGRQDGTGLEGRGEGGVAVVDLGDQYLLEATWSAENE